MTASGTSLPVYQLRGVLHGISPLIWRRLLVAGDTSIAGLPDVLQVERAAATSGTAVPRAYTARVRCSAPGSAIGSPSTARMSASNPGAMRPLRRPSPVTPAAAEVTDGNPVGVHGCRRAVA